MVEAPAVQLRDEVMVGMGEDVGVDEGGGVGKDMGEDVGMHTLKALIRSGSGIQLRLPQMCPLP